MGSIRLFLAFTVLMSHVNTFNINMNIIPGSVAVQAFFIISGFYMSLILDRKYNRSRVFVFYTNRLLRLFPPYLVVLLASVGVLYALDIGAFTTIDKFEKVLGYGPFMAVSYVWTNIGVLGQELLFLLGIDTEHYFFYWAPDGMASVRAWTNVLIPQAWSLSMELYFYLLAPFIVRRRIYWIGLLFLLSLGLRLFIISKGPYYDLLLRRFFPAELCLFLVGYFSYFLFTKIQEYGTNRSLGCVCWLTVLAVLVFYNKINETYSLTLLTFTLFIATPFIFTLAKNSRLDRFLGKISYSVYLVHFLIIAIFEEYFEEEYSLFILLPVVFCVSLATYYGIEAPIDSWRQRRVMAR